MAGPLIVPHLTAGEGAGRGTTLYIISVVMVIVAGFAVIVRFASMHKSRAKFWWDDGTVLCALFFSVILTIAECSAVTNGYGEHTKDLGHAQTVKALKWFYVAQIFYKLVISFDKLTILFFYLRIFPNDLFRYFVFAGLAFVGGECIAFVFGTIWQCTPLPFFWDRTIKGGSCIPAEPWWVSFSALNIFADFYILILPIPLVLRLNLSKKVRLGVIGIFAMGSFVCFTTIMRMTTLASSAAGTDPTYDPLPATNWSVIESNTGLICTCLPMLRRYVDSIFGMCFGSRANTTDTSIPYGVSHRSRGFALGPLSKEEDTIYGTLTGEQWGTVDNSIASQGHAKELTESQENIVEQGIYRSVDITVYRGDSRSDNGRGVISSD